MNKYNKSKIYKVYCDCHNLTYYGSSIKTLNKRLEGHKACYKAYKNGCKLYTSIFNIFNVCDNYKIELVEEVCCDNIQQLRKIEGNYIKNNECVNKLIPSRTNKQWRMDNKKHIKIQRKGYYDENRDIILKRNKKWRENNKEKCKEIRNNWVDKNRGKISEYRKKNKYKCECGSFIRKSGIVPHKKTKKHLKFIKSSE
jgi:hypothetical protein